MPVFDSVTDLADAVGVVIGTSDWIEVGQDRINGFADVTDDHQWIHVDPDRAAGGPFGGTIAHGYLTLALAAPVMEQVLHIGDLGSAVNYGLGKVRFPSPVPSGSRVRGTLSLLAADPVAGGYQATFELVIAVENADRPACVAEVLVRLYPTERRAA
ncbi:MaoC family dehydratase [Nakamurella alba]|uniref:MaoC family dehydratase n=1 Tax=Nakamurella alba TaxID=2665158 RepID=UPI002AC359F7|nr:MaoC family dehydratase [Nakamurella alba]